MKNSASLISCSEILNFLIFFVWRCIKIFFKGLKKHSFYFTSQIFIYENFCNSAVISFSLYSVKHISSFFKSNHSKLLRFPSSNQPSSTIDQTEPQSFNTADVSISTRY